MLKPLLLFKRPHSVLLLDDDAAFMSWLSLSLPYEWRLNCFSNDIDAAQYLNQSMVDIQADWSLLEDIANSTDSSSKLIQVLSYWHQQTQRWQLCQLGIVDYAMPGLTGVDFLSQFPNWAGNRILLTGFADERVAVQAFNTGAIQQYIRKQNQNLAQLIVNSAGPLNHDIAAEYQKMWHAKLSIAQRRVLRDKNIAHQLAQWCDTHLLEYIFLSNPFGIVGLNAQGQLHWVQLVFAQQLPELEQDAKEQGWDEVTLGHVREGKAISNYALRAALDEQIEPMVTHLTPLGDGELWAGVFQFTPPVHLSSTLSYEHWIASHKPS
jgi:CheY-like chemotaxis protein